MRVLMVDDSRTMRRILRAALGDMGLSDVEEACDGAEALRAYEARRPDLVLLDWNMPGMDGLTFVKTLRQRDTATPVIMVTTETERSRVIEAIKAGVSNYVLKPFTTEELQERIAETLGSSPKARA